VVLQLTVPHFLLNHHVDTQGRKGKHLYGEHTTRIPHYVPGSYQ